MVIRDDHLGCYYLDNAAMRLRGEIRTARDAGTMNYSLEGRILLRPRLSRPRRSMAAVGCPPTEKMISDLRYVVKLSIPVTRNHSLRY